MEKSFCEQFQKEFASLKANKALFDIELLESQKEYNRDKLKRLKKQIELNILSMGSLDDIIKLKKPENLKDLAGNIDKLKVSYFKKVATLYQLLFGLKKASKESVIKDFKDKVEELPQKEIERLTGRLPVNGQQILYIVDYIERTLKDFYDLDATGGTANGKLSLVILDLIGKKMIKAGRGEGNENFSLIIKSLRAKDYESLIKLFEEQGSTDPLIDSANYLEYISKELNPEKKGE